LGQITIHRRSSLFIENNSFSWIFFICFTNPDTMVRLNKENNLLTLYDYKGISMKLIAQFVWPQLIVSVLLVFLSISCKTDDPVPIFVENLSDSQNVDDTASGMDSTNWTVKSQDISPDEISLFGSFMGGTYPYVFTSDSNSYVVTLKRYALGDWQNALTLAGNKYDVKEVGGNFFVAYVDTISNKDRYYTYNGALLKGDSYGTTDSGLYAVEESGRYLFNAFSWASVFSGKVFVLTTNDNKEAFEDSVTSFWVYYHGGFNAQSPSDYPEGNEWHRLPTYYKDRETDHPTARSVWMEPPSHYGMSWFAGDMVFAGGSPYVLNEHWGSYYLLRYFHPNDFDYGTKYGDYTEGWVIQEIAPDDEIADTKISHIGNAVYVVYRNKTDSTLIVERVVGVDTLSQTVTIDLKPYYEGYGYPEFDRLESDNTHIYIYIDAFQTIDVYIENGSKVCSTSDIYNRYETLEGPEVCNGDFYTLGRSTGYNGDEDTISLLKYVP